MKPGFCHLCDQPLFPRPVMELPGMPKAAQYYPTREEFPDDRGITLRIHQCASCGLVQLNGTPVDYFREVITAAVLSPKARASRLEQMGEFVRRFGLEGRQVLEIGSGSGGMLEVLEEAGMRATGLEAAPAPCAAAQATGKRLLQGYLGEMETIPGAPFDAFIALNYLEHLPRPGAIIRKLHQCTTEGAAGFITVPNLEYLLRSQCFYEFVADHLSYFTPRTLTQAFERNGFDVVECRTINNDNDILVLVEKKRPLAIADQYEEVERLIVQLRGLVADYTGRGKKVAVWGAGHRTLALLALAGVDEVACVIDSAPFKQGRFTPVLHHPIIAPTALPSSGIDLVIVMVPGLYPGEVIQTIANMGLTIEVASLVGNRIEFLGASATP